MSLTPEQIRQICEIIETHIELLDDRLAYFQGDVNGAYFNALIAERDRAKSLLLDVVRSASGSFTLVTRSRYRSKLIMDDDIEPFQVHCETCGNIYLTVEEDVSPAERAKRQCRSCERYESIYWDTKDEDD